MKKIPGFSDSFSGRGRGKLYELSQISRTSAYSTDKFGAAASIPPYSSGMIHPHIST